MIRVRVKKKGSERGDGLRRRMSTKRDNGVRRGVKGTMFSVKRERVGWTDVVCSGERTVTVCGVAGQR